LWKLYIIIAPRRSATQAIYRKSKHLSCDLASLICLSDVLANIHILPLDNEPGQGDVDISGENGTININR
jgi:hypothetical protein